MLRIETTVGLALLGIALAATPVGARGYDPVHPWFAEGSLGIAQSGPGEADLGDGQNYAAHVGWQLNPWSDASLSLAWTHLRSNDEALDTDVTSLGLRLRALAGGQRWSVYGEAATRVYLFGFEQLSVLAPVNDHDVGYGGEIGGGVLYARSTWWGGIGAELHGALGIDAFEDVGTASFVTYTLFVGAPLGF